MKPAAENGKVLPESAKQEGKSEAIQLIIKLIEEYQISGSELASHLKQQVVPRRRVSRVKAKYKGPEGELWSGRGAKPAWVKQIVGCGHDLDSYLIAADSTK